MIVVSQILVTKNMPKSIHGTVAGTFSVTGGFGIIFMSYLGGYLFGKGSSCLAVELVI